MLAGAVHVSLIAKYFGEAAKGNCHLGVIGSQGCLVDGQRPFQILIGAAEVSHCMQQHAEVVKGGSHLGVVGSSGRLLGWPGHAPSTGGRRQDPLGV